MDHAIMSGTTAPKQQQPLEARLSRGGTIFVVLMTIAAGIVADQLYPGWGRSVLGITGVFTIMISIWRQLWTKWWYWATLISLFVLHVVMFLRFDALRNYVERENPIVGFLFAVLDVFFVALVLGIIASVAGSREKEGVNG